MSDETETGVGSQYRNMVVGLSADKKLQYTRMICPNGIFDPRWNQVGSASYFGSMASGITTEGHVAIVASETESRHVHFYMEETDGDANNPIGWSDVLDMGLPDGVTEFSQLQLTRGAQGLDSVFGVAAESQDVWWKTENPNKIVSKTETVTPPGSDTPIEITVDEIEPPDEVWSDWMKLPEQPLKEIYVSQNANDTVVVVGLDGGSQDIFVSQQDLDHPQSNTEWATWDVIDTFQATQVLCYLGVDMRMNIFAIELQNPKIVKQVVQAKSSQNIYETPVSLPEAPEALGRIKVNEGQNGGLYMVGLAAEPDDKEQSKLFVIRQIPDDDGNPQWGEWSFVRHFTPGGLPSLDIEPDGRMVLYYWSSGADGHLYYTVEVSPNTGNFPQDITKIGDSLRGLGHAHDLSLPATSLNE